MCTSLGDQAANALVEYHQCNGGISRFEKFRYFIHSILPKCNNSRSRNFHNVQLEMLLHNYREALSSQLLHCPWLIGYKIFEHSHQVQGGISFRVDRRMNSVQFLLNVVWLLISTVAFLEAQTLKNISWLVRLVHKIFFNQLYFLEIVSMIILRNKVLALILCLFLLGLISALGKNMLVSIIFSMFKF